jgi:hypothetical protein
MSQYWLADIPGTTISSSEGERIAVLGRTLGSTSEAALVGGMGLGSVGVVVPLASTALGTGYTLESSNSGKIHLIAATTAANCALVLPDEADGLNYKIVYVGAAAEGQNYTIGTEAAANYFIGGLTHLYDGSSATSITIGAVFSDGNSNSLITLITPSAGTEINLHCNGTAWYVWGQVVSATIPTIADT